MTAEAIPTIRVKSDAARRKRLMVSAAMSHPAKMHMGILDEVVARYNIKAGDWVLDPMAGVGTTAILALQGINVCLVELESHFLDTIVSFECSGQVPGWKVEWVEPQEEGWYVRAGFGADIRVFGTEAEARDFYQKRMEEKGDVRGEVEWRPFVKGHEEYIPLPARCGKRGKHKRHWQVGSWDKMRQNPMLGYELGKMLILRGDARALPIASADSIVTSPPWEEATAAAGGNQETNWFARHPEIAKRGGGTVRNTYNPGYTRPDAIVTSPPYEEAHQGGEDPHPERMAGSESGLASVRYTRPDAIVTSPPYEGVEKAGKSGIDWEKSVKKVQRPNSYRKSYRGIDAIAAGYTRPVDAVISSPPYEGSVEQHKEGLSAYYEGQQVGGPNSMARRRGYTRPIDAVVSSPPYDNRLADKYDDGDKARVQYFLAGAETPGNVGNERGPQYWLSMSKIYQECYRVLRPGGLMCLVLKGFTRDGKYIDLPGMTAEMVQSLGFVPHDHWRRELWGLSFWRILQRKRSPDTFDDRLNYEEVRVFKR